MGVVKRLKFNKEARSALRKGVCVAADAIRMTMGARGRLVSLSNGNLTKDGVSVARDIELEDPFENKGARLVREASMKTCDDVGDGTTLTAVLTRALVTRGFDLVDEGKDPQELVRELRASEPEVLKLIQKESKKVTDSKEAASISANDSQIGEVVAKAVNAVGHSGLVTVETAYVQKDEVEIVKGMQIDQGVLHQAFYTDHARRRTEYKDARVILYAGNLHDINGFAAIASPLVSSGKALVVIAHSFDDMVMHSFLKNRIEQGLKIIPVVAPHVYREEVMEDLAAYTGAIVLTENDTMDKVFAEDVAGTIPAITAFHDRTVLQPSKEQEEAITERIAAVYEHAKLYKEDERREVEKRAARLSGKIAVIRTGSVTTREDREKRDRYEDAIYAAQSALKSGVVAGGGLTWVKVSQKMKKDTEGAEMLSKVFLAPISQIAENAGRNPTEVVKLAKRGLGYNAMKDSFEDMLEAGIVDPTAVLTHAFENALSVSCLMIIADALNAVVETKEE